MQIAYETWKKLRFNFGLTHSFPFIHNNSDEMISGYDKYLRELYIDPYYLMIQDIYPSLSIPKGIIYHIYEYEYGERAYRVFKHYLVQKLKSQHDSTIYIIPFILGYIQLICILFITISVFQYLNLRLFQNIEYNSNPTMLDLFASLQFKIYIFCNLCHVVGIILSYFNAIKLSKKLKIMNEQLLLYIYGGDNNKFIDINGEIGDDEEAEVIFNFKRNYSNHSNCSNVSNGSTSSTQSTFSALHAAFGLNDDEYENNKIFGHYTSFFIEDYMSKMRTRLTHNYDINAFDGFQRWCNVYEMEISDVFISNYHILILLFSKYIIPTIFSLLLYGAAIRLYHAEELYLLLIGISCLITSIITYCCGVSLFHYNKHHALKRSICFFIISFCGHLGIIFVLWINSNSNNSNNSMDDDHEKVAYFRTIILQQNINSVTYLLINGHWITDYLIPIWLFILSGFLIYKFIYFPIVERVILNAKCNNLSQSVKIYKTWSYLICCSFFISFLFVLPSWRCNYCIICSLILVWILCIIIYVWIQLTCHQALTTMTAQMYLFNYVQYSRKWICQPILFLFAGQIVYLLPIFKSNN